MANAKAIFLVCDPTHTHTLWEHFAISNRINFVMLAHKYIRCRRCCHTRALSPCLLFANLSLCVAPSLCSCVDVTEFGDSDLKFFCDELSNTLNPVKWILIAYLASSSTYLFFFLYLNQHRLHLSSSFNRSPLFHILCAENL